MFAADFHQGEGLMAIKEEKQEEETFEWPTPAALVKMVQELEEDRMRRESSLKEQLRAADAREAALSFKLASNSTRPGERKTLLKQILDARKGREAELLLRNRTLESVCITQLFEWKSMFYEAAQGWQGAKDEIAAKEIALEEAEQAMDAQIKQQLQFSQLAALAQAQGETMTVSDKDLTIMTLQAQCAALQEATKKAQDAVELSNDSTIKTLRQVTQKVVALTKGLQQFQLGNKNERPANIVYVRRRREISPTTLESSTEEVMKNLDHANVALAEAAKKWKKAEGTLAVVLDYEDKVLKSYTGRRCILDKILSKGLAYDAVKAFNAAALTDLIPDEERSPATHAES